MSTLTIPYTGNKVIETEIIEPVGNGSAVVRITIVRGRRVIRRESDCYWVDPVRSDWGKAWVFTKCEMPTDGTDEHYHVLVANPQDFFCECLGFSAHGCCKHTIAALRLCAEGLL
jgi:hypothetical protein